MEFIRQIGHDIRSRATIEANDGPIRLDVTGPEGTQEFLDELMSPDRAADR